ncbi:MAG: hypothetical protein IJG37_07110, partial [Synergistaceae bacterium]|nr:hypothetical protein [Synergistaceae bacterium]
MPDDLDPITARLVSELSASILPALTKSLAAAVPSADFAALFERSSKVVEKAVRVEIDDSRAGRSMIMQSIATVLEECANLRRTVDRLPEVLAASVKSSQPEITQITPAVPDNLAEELEGISRRLDTLTQGIKDFFETYAEHRENDAPVPEIMRPSFDPEIFTGLEGLIRAEGRSHTQELTELSREVTAMTEENSKALVHEVREAVAEEISGINGGNIAGKSGSDGGNVKL